MSDDRTIVAAVVVYPFTVIDAALGEFFLSYLPEGMNWHWGQRTSGSSIHSVMQDDREMYHVVVRAMSANKTSLVLENVAPLYVMPAFGKQVLGRFAAWLNQDQSNLKHLSPPDPTDGTPAPRRRRQPHPEDDWAWEQVNVLGRKPEEVRAEWERRAEHRRLSDPARSFRHVINSKRRIKHRNIPPA